MHRMLKQSNSNGNGENVTKLGKVVDDHRGEYIVKEIHFCRTAYFETQVTKRKRTAVLAGHIKECNELLN